MYGGEGLTTRTSLRLALAWLSPRSGPRPALSIFSQSAFSSLISTCSCTPATKGQTQYA